MTLEHLKGHWALVTGASSGIGAEYCRQLAAAGVNLVMVARRKELLDTLAASLTRVHAVRTLVLVLDLSVRDLLRRELPTEPDLSRWFAVWGAPGL